jgi:hypothetical protein
MRTSWALRRYIPLPVRSGRPMSIALVFFLAGYISAQSPFNSMGEAQPAPDTSSVSAAVPDASGSRPGAETSGLSRSGVPNAVSGSAFFKQMFRDSLEMGLRQSMGADGMGPGDMSASGGQGRAREASSMNFGSAGGPGAGHGASPGGGPGGGMGPGAGFGGAGSYLRLASDLSAGLGAGQSGALAATLRQVPHLASLMQTGIGFSLGSSQSGPSGGGRQGSNGSASGFSPQHGAGLGQGSDPQFGTSHQSDGSRFGFSAFASVGASGSGFRSMGGTASAGMSSFGSFRRHERPGEWPDEWCRSFSQRWQHAQRSARLPWSTRSAKSSADVLERFSNRCSPCKDCARWLFLKEKATHRLWFRCIAIGEHL